MPLLPFLTAAAAAGMLRCLLCYAATVRQQKVIHTIFFYRYKTVGVFKNSFMFLKEYTGI
jgi:hypothetical protein